MNEQVLNKIVETTRQHWGLDKSGAGSVQALKAVPQRQQAGDSQPAAEPDA